MSKHILLLEDDLELARLMQDCMSAEGYSVSHAYTAARATQLVHQQLFDLVICDVMLPGKSGFSFVEDIRDSFAGPILFMTAQNSLKQQLYGFELGAQDYLLKPIDPRLLLAKIKVFLTPDHAALPLNTQYEQLNLKLDCTTKAAWLDDVPLDLTTAEFRLLEALMQRYGAVVSRDWLFQNHLGRDYDGTDRTMDGRVSRLRKKLQAVDPAWNIVISWGEGYYLAYKPT
ncbi:response regulator transcription factor [Rheinheimera maricola]|uniref:Response regulator transcription factor n=1 Tax=Rheinheimera maricola TaxID=2793282 RepID=A0ABS7X7C5_9GAMM|nr:response regulator transcription factor [Rheinheimera maricola]MBZ9611456.1 response regulator transcription factor [Rheinheimera maricola]